MHVDVSPEGRIRSYLDANGGSAEVSVLDLLSTWGLQQASAENAQGMQSALSRVGISTTPELAGLAESARVTVTVRPAPPWGVPQQPAAAPQQSAASQQPAAFQQPAAPEQPAIPQQPQAPPERPATPPAQPPVGYAQPPAAATVVSARTVPSNTPSALGIAGAGLAVAGALLALIASLVPWVSSFDRTFTYWQFNRASDIVLALLVLATVVLGASAIAAPRVAPIRTLLAVTSAGVVALTFLPAIEFLAQNGEGVSTIRAGEILAMVAGLVLVAGLALQITTLRSGQTARATASTPLLIGLAALALVGLAEPLVSLLPYERGISSWEEKTVSDILGTLITLSLTAAAITALLRGAGTRMLAVAFVLGSYLVIADTIGVIESLLAHFNGAAVFVALFFIVPLALSGTVLVATGARFGRAPAPG